MYIYILLCMYIIMYIYYNVYIYYYVYIYIYIIMYIYCESNVVASPPGSRLPVLTPVPQLPNLMAIQSTWAQG